MTNRRYCKTGGCGFFEEHEGAELCRGCREGWSEAIKREQKGKEDYDKYLLTDHWLYLAAEAKRLAEERCQLCYRGGHLHAHHRTYIRYPYRERITDITVMCDMCHKIFTMMHTYEGKSGEHKKKDKTMYVIIGDDDNCIVSEWDNIEEVIDGDKN